MLKMFSVYDSAVEAFMTPFFCRSRGEAVRSFMDACQDGKTNFCRHPSDYTLFEVGQFYEDNGGISIPKAPDRCISALECVREDGGQGEGKLPSPDYSISLNGSSNR